MRWQRRTALWAYREVLGFQTVVCTTIVCSRVGVFSFWNSHVSVLVNFVKGLIRFRFTALGTAKVTRLSRSLQPVIAISCPNSKQNRKKLANNRIPNALDPVDAPQDHFLTDTGQANLRCTTYFLLDYFCLASFALRRSSMMSS